MRVEVDNTATPPRVAVSLGPGEEFAAAASALLRADENVTVEIETLDRGPGVAGGFRGVLSPGRFLKARFRASPDRGAVVQLKLPASAVPHTLHVEQSDSWLCAGDDYLASSPTVAIDSRFPGFAGMRKGEAPFFLRVSGIGDVYLAPPVPVMELAVRSALTIDVSQLVAFEEKLGYAVLRAGRRGVVGLPDGVTAMLHFTGSGRILVKSQNATSAAP